ncbi:MAG TPA: ROK family protein [Steroidobacteraceae bacterium]
MTRASGRGKAPRRLSNCVLGIDVGGTNIRAGLYSPGSATLRCVRATRTEAAQGGSHALQQLSKLARQVAEAGAALGLRIRQCGIGLPELIGLGGEIESHCTLSWKSKDLHKCLRPFGPLTIASDVITAARAEARLGAGRDQSAFLYVTVGTGMSCALVVNGEPYLGPHGHAISFASGPSVATLGADGKTVYAPLEYVAAGPGLLRRAQALGLAETSTEALCQSARQAPGPARDLIDAAATELAVHVAILANQLEPTLIVMGGGLGCAPGRYWDSFRAALPRFTFGPHMRRLPVRRARLRNEAGMIGAALSALEMRQSSGGRRGR